MKRLLNQTFVMVALLAPLLLQGQEIRVIVQKPEEVPGAIQIINEGLPQTLTIEINDQKIPDVDQKATIIGTILDGITHEAKQKILQLSLTNNQLNSLPTQSILGLSNLVTLDLSNNNLTKFPKVEGLQNLVVVDLSGSQTLTGDPMGFMLFITPDLENQLNTLIIGNHEQQVQVLIQELVGKINAHKPSQLQIQYRDATQPSDNKRTVILDRILNAITDEAKSTITVLEISLSDLIQPPVLIGFSNLAVLNLETNELTEPPNLSTVPNLEALYLSTNQLSRPPQLSGLKKLKELNLAYNQLSRPPQLSGLKKLKELNLENNPLLQGPIIIPFYLQDLKITGIDPNNVVREKSIQSIEQLRDLLARNTAINIAYPEVTSREHFITDFMGRGRTGDFLAAGVVLGEFDVLERLNEALRQEQQEQLTRLILPGAAEKVLLDIPTSDNRTPRIFTQHFFDYLKQKLEKDLQHLKATLESEKMPQELITVTLKKYGINPATLNLNQADEKTPILLLTETPRTLAQSWQYWKTQGMSLDEFLKILNAGDPVTDQEFTTTRATANEFLRDIGLDTRRIETFMQQLPDHDFIGIPELVTFVEDEQLVDFLRQVAEERPTKKRTAEEAGFQEGEPSSKEPKNK